jgi:hypothetical protein
MAQERRSIRNRSTKVHPLFIKLYLTSDPDEEQQPERRARQRRSILQKRTTRSS